MDSQARRKLTLELTAERDELNRRAAELERSAALDKRSDATARLEAEASGLRDSARETNRRLDELADSEIHDDDRGGIER
jgi:hypothetical protein